MKKRDIPMPTVEQMEKELHRIEYRKNYNRALSSTVFTLVVVAAIAILVAMLFMPVLRIYGSSMTPALHDGEIVVTLKGSKFERSDIIAFYYNNKILIKRAIAFPGEWVNIDENGNVYVNDVMLEEAYIDEKVYGDVNIEMPYQVPDGRYFVMGDHRQTSADSRNTAVGCVTEEQIVGRVALRVWPFDQFGMVD